MERWQNRVAVVTGASSGIGKAIVSDLVRTGLRVVGLARRIDRMVENRLQLPIELQGRYFTLKVDITEESEVKEAFAWIEKNVGGVDILVNNAGIVRQGKLLEIDMEIVENVMNTNVKGLIYATQAAYRSMKARSVRGHIIHINSILGHTIVGAIGVPSLNIYSPTKFSVTAINETLRHELRELGTGIKTTSISPGVVRSEMHSEAVNKFAGESLLEPEDVSKAVLFAISTPEHVQIHELTIKAVGEAT